MSQCRERRKNQQFGINENYWYTCIYVKYTFITQAYMFKDNVDTARKYAYPFLLSDYIAYLNVLHIYFFWTSIRTCVNAYAWIGAWTHRLIKVNICTK